MKTTKNTPLFLKCDCHTHAIEFDWDKEAKQLNVAIWWDNPKRTLIAWQRLRWAWRILVTGNPWGDTVLLNQKKIDSLKKYLNKIEN